MRYNAFKLGVIMAEYSDFRVFLDRKSIADQTKTKAEELEMKGNYAEAKKYYFEAAKKYKNAADYAQKFGYGVYGKSYSFFDKAEEMMMEYEYCMMQVKAMSQSQFGFYL